MNKIMDSKETRNQKRFCKINISPEKLPKHFITTLTSQRKVNIPLDSTEKGNLDTFTLEELKKASSILKKGKATCIDNLCYEMIACLIDIYPTLSYQTI